MYQWLVERDDEEIAETEENERRKTGVETTTTAIRMRLSMGADQHPV